MQLCDCKSHLCLLCKYTGHTQLFHCSSQLPMPGVGLDAYVGSGGSFQNALVILVLWEVYWTNKVAFPVGKCFLVFILSYICWVTFFLRVSINENILHKSTAGHFVISCSHAVAQLGSLRLNFARRYLYSAFRLRLCCSWVSLIGIFCSHAAKIPCYQHHLPLSCLKASYIQVIL